MGRGRCVGHRVGVRAGEEGGVGGRVLELEQGSAHYSDWLPLGFQLELCVFFLFFCPDVTVFVLPCRS